MKQWYAVHTKPNSERRVAVHLEREDIETFLPTVAGDSNDQAKGDPFFPGYLFMRVNYDRADPSDWRWVPGFRRIVAYGNFPIPVADEVITLLANRVAGINERGKRQRLPFAPGDLVRIKSGPFSDMVGIFDGPTDPTQRVRVLLEAMNRSMRVRVEPSALEKAEPQEPGDKTKSGRPPRRTRGRGRPIRSRS